MILLSAAVLCASGVLTAWAWDRTGALLAGAGLVFAGAWLALMIRDRDKEE